MYKIINNLCKSQLHYFTFTNVNVNEQNIKLGVSNLLKIDFKRDFHINRRNFVWWLTLFNSPCPKTA